MNKICITGGKLFNGKDTTIFENPQVIIEGNKIVGVNKEENQQPVGEDYKKITLNADHFIFPGLIDSHVHVQSSGQPNFEDDFKDSVALMGIRAGVNATKTLMAGFTTIRDASAESLIDISVKKAIEKGYIKGPRMLVSCRGLSITGGHGDHANGWPPEVSFAQRYVVDGPLEVRKAVREQLRDGADVIKVAATGGILSTGDNPDHIGLRVDEMREAVEEAQNAGKKVMAHAQGAVGIKNAIIAGVHSIEHGSILTDEIIEMMIEKGVFLVPTLVAGYLISEKGSEAGIPENSVKKAKQIVDLGFENFKKAYKAGVKIAMGTDAGTCFNFHGNNAKELELMVNSGMSPFDALQAATIKGAELLDLSETLGSIEAGKLADIVIVEGNPIENIKIFQDKELMPFIIKDGELIKGK